MKIDIDAGHVGFILFLFSVALFVPIFVCSAEDFEYRIESVELTIYRDGLVHVVQVLSVNETLPSVSVVLLTPSVENLFVVDENQTVLDCDVLGENLTIYSLGARSITVEYDSVSLTRKESGVWTLNLKTPYNLTVYLPDNSTIVYLSDIPTSIDAENGRIKIRLFPDVWEISYVLPVAPKEEFKVSDLHINPEEVEAGKEVTITVLVINQGRTEGSYAAVLKINGTTEETKTIILASGESKTVEFKVKKENLGNYIVEIGGLKGQFSVKDTSPPTTLPMSLPLTPFPLEYLVVVLAAVVGTVLLFLLFRKKEPNPSKIFEDHPELRDEDRSVILFIAERGGKVFESELRERFGDLPRTSLWRLVRRLENMEIVTVKKIGLQNQVELKKR
ncbi:MAG: CARDB domain-containing protein [Candidatus Bathyarchaeia archaeon]